MNQNPTKDSVSRRFYRLTNAHTKRANAIRALPIGSPERRAALERWRWWLSNVARPLDARLWPLMKRHGLGADVM